MFFKEVYLKLIKAAFIWLKKYIYFEILQFKLTGYYSNKMCSFHAKLKYIYDKYKM